MGDNAVEMSATHAGWTVLVSDAVGVRSKSFSFKELADTYAKAEADRLQVGITRLRAEPLR